MYKKVLLDKPNTRVYWGETEDGFYKGNYAYIDMEFDLEPFVDKTYVMIKLDAEGVYAIDVKRCEDDLRSKFKNYFYENR